MLVNFTVKCVCQINNVSKKTSKYDITHILSINDPQVKPYFHPHRKTENKMMVFEDSEFRNDKTAPTQSHIKEIIEWAENLPDDANVLVHCYAGVSRSSAAAIIVELVRKKAKTSAEIEMVYEYIHNIRSVMAPNRLMIEYADNLLELDGKLIGYHLKRMEEKEKFLGRF